jgi:hypothetical protein
VAKRIEPIAISAYRGVTDVDSEVLLYVVVLCCDGGLVTVPESYVLVVCLVAVVVVGSG